jgi:hypothetical protein
VRRSIVQKSGDKWIKDKSIKVRKAENMMFNMAISEIVSNLTR